MRWLCAFVLACCACGDDTQPSADGPSVDAPIDANTSGDGAPGDAMADAMLGRMVHIPSGSFMMGCAAGDPQCGADEYPPHQVTLSAFDIDRFEVTQAEYQTCITAGSCTQPAANFDPVANADIPVRDVSWDQAAAYCQFAGKRLPTEAQWEFAARGTDGRLYPWGNQDPTCTLANFGGCGGAPVAAGHDPGQSPFLELDAAGNVWEWVADYYDAAYYASSPSMDPTGPASGQNRVARGGSYTTTADALRCSNRVTGVQTLPYDDFGIRCAR